MYSSLCVCVCVCACACVCVCVCVCVLNHWAVWRVENKVLLDWIGGMGCCFSKHCIPKSKAVKDIVNISLFLECCVILQS